MMTRWHASAHIKLNTLRSVSSSLRTSATSASLVVLTQACAMLKSSNFALLVCLTPTQSPTHTGAKPWWMSYELIHTVVLSLGYSLAAMGRPSIARAISTPPGVCLAHATVMSQLVMRQQRPEQCLVQRVVEQCIARHCSTLLIFLTKHSSCTTKTSTSAFARS